MLIGMILTVWEIGLRLMSVMIRYLWMYNLVFYSNILGITWNRITRLAL